MLSKQEKDLEHLRQLNTKLEDDLIRRQNEEKRLFLKSLRQEQRSRREMYRRSLYIIPSNNQNVGNSSSNGDSFKMSADEEKRKLKEVFLAFIYHYDINFNKKIFSSLRKEKKKDLKMNCKD